MRGGVRLPALIVMAGLLAGCSDPAGAARKEQAAARKRSPSPRPPASRHPATPRVTRHATAATWWQASGSTRTSGGLRVRTGALRGGRMKIIITDVADHTPHTITASSAPRTAVVGRFTLTALTVRRAHETGPYGVGFRYRAR